MQLPKADKKSVAIWALTAAYAGAIFWLSAQSKPPMPPGSEGIPDFSVYVHFAEYAAFGALALLSAFAMAGGARQPGAAVWAAAAAIAAAYAAGDEYHQSFVPGRAMTLEDFLVDCAGIAAAFALAFIWRRHKGGASPGAGAGA